MGTNSAVRAVASIRVSDTSQVEGYSLDGQEGYCREYFQGKGWGTTQIYREEGISARYDEISKRPVLQELLRDAKSGLFDVVVVHALDRWARNLKVMLETLSLLGRHNVGFISITENLD